jgi:CHAT domain-containing protein
MMPRQAGLRGIALMLVLLGGQLPVLAQHNSPTPNAPRSGGATPSSERTDFLERADALNQQIAELYQAGRYSEAMPLAESVLAMYRAQWAARHPLDLAIALINLANIYNELGLYGKAEPLYLEVLAIHRMQLGDSHPQVANTLNQLAWLYVAQDRYDEAELLALEMLSIRQGQLSDSHPQISSSLNQLAQIYFYQGRYSDAEQLYLDALERQRRRFNDDPGAVAATLQSLATVYGFQGRYAEADALYLEALTIWQRQPGDLSTSIAALRGLAALYDALGRDQVTDVFQSALDLEEQNLALNLLRLNDVQRQAYVATFAQSTTEAISLHLDSAPENSGAANLALTTLLRRKGRVLDVGADSLQALRQNLTPTDQARLDALTKTRQRLATLTFDPPPDLSPQQYQETLAQLATTANRLEAELAQSSAAFRAETQTVTVTAVREKIPTDGVLLEYVRYRPAGGEFDAEGNGRFFDPDRYGVYLLFPDGRIESFGLGPATQIDAAVEAFSRNLQDRSQSPTAAAEAIFREIMGPMWHHLEDRNHILISPDSQLNRIPFEALRTADNRYLVQDYQISYLNSGRDLLKFDVTEPSTAPAVIVANPDYEVADASIQIASTRSSQRSAELSQLQFGPLPGTAAEAEAIQQYLPNAEVLTADQATENTLKQTEAPRILHIATHGFFLANVDRPEGNDSRGLVLVAADNAPGSPPQVAVENPLLRSGLALAGFNSRSSGSEDGVLTALEASTLNLFGTQLVVLSACDTGLGDIANGEGVYGLRRAFAIAGAESQLLSLWQVDDFGTQSLMARYYENLTAGMGRSGALRAVQLEMIDSQSRYAHPYYWAAFILAGDWQPLAE